MSSDTCRLCLSKNNLISLFSGKSRNIRNFLRKMIQETIQIKIEHDYCNSSICFNCCSDISNFYYFKLHCLRNEKPTKDTNHFVTKNKRAKLNHIDLKDIQPPNLESAESVITWLNAKKNSLITEDIQPVPLLCNISTQSDVVEMMHNECQTIKPVLMSSETQCNEIIPCLTPKKDFKTCSSQTKSISNNPKLLKCTYCLKQNTKTPKKKNRNVYSQTTNALFKIKHEDESKSSLELTKSVIKKLSESYCQTDSNNFVNRYVQTEPKKLSIKLYETSVCSERNTNDGFSQTTVRKLLNKFSQCNILNLNGCHTRKWPIRKKSRSSLETNKNYGQIADPQSFDDALIDGFDDTFVSKTTQTEFNQFEQYDINQSDSKNSNFLSPKTNSYLESNNSKPIFLSPEDIKQEKELFLESLSICSKSPPKEFLLSPKSADLMQINSNKADHVKICKLCDMALYNRKEIILHNKTHMQCNICRKKFRTLKAAQNHIEDCKQKSPISNISIEDATKCYKENILERKIKYVTQGMGQAIGGRERLGGHTFTWNRSSSALYYKNIYY